MAEKLGRNELATKMLMNGNTLNRTGNVGVRGSIDLETFESMNISAKLNVLFEKANNFELDQESLLPAKESMSCTEQKVESLGSHVNSNTDNLGALTYKYLDLETRSRQKNLLIYGLTEISEESTYNIVADRCHKLIQKLSQILFLKPSQNKLWLTWARNGMSAQM